MKTKRSFGYAIFSALIVFSALQGCNDDGDGNEKPPTVKPTGGSGNAGGEGGSGGDGTGNTGNTGNTDQGGTGAVGGAPDPIGGAGGEGGTPPDTCGGLPPQGEDGCYNCPADGEIEQWINRCVDGDCVPFDNTRVTLLEDDGSLPDLP